jgi:hypothetical protein
MPVTVKVNGMANSLVHKGSNGISTATIPDVCKTPTPGGPVPLPYPNISQATTLSKGTTTVKADGGMMIAIKGSEFSMSNGDEPGTVGGVKSSTFIKESTWILYSFDVKMDGKNACRLSDKKFQNHENAADLAGELQPPVVGAPPPPELQAIADCCNQAVDCAAEHKGKGCRSRGVHKHSCCDKAIKRRKENGDWSNVQPEAPHPPTKTMNACRLDVQIKTNGRTSHIYDFKFNCEPKKPTMAQAQIDKYAIRFRGAIVEPIGAQGAKKAPPSIAACKGAPKTGSC